MTEPRSSARDSSLQDRKAPEVWPLRTRQPRPDNVVHDGARRQSQQPPQSLSPCGRGFSARRDTARAAGLTELPRDDLDAFGGGGERGGEGTLRVLGLVGGGGAVFLEVDDFVFEAADAL